MGTARWPWSGLVLLVLPPALYIAALLVVEAVPLRSPVHAVPLMAAIYCAFTGLGMSWSFLEQCFLLADWRTRRRSADAPASSQEHCGRCGELLASGVLLPTGLRYCDPCLQRIRATHSAHGDRVLVAGESVERRAFGRELRATLSWYTAFPVLAVLSFELATGRPLGWLTALTMLIVASGVFSLLVVLVLLAGRSHRGLDIAVDSGTLRVGPPNRPPTLEVPLAAIQHVRVTPSQVGLVVGSQPILLHRAYFDDPRLAPILNLLHERCGGYPGELDAGDRRAGRTRRANP